MIRVLVLGGDGMLGHMVVRELSSDPGLEVSHANRRAGGGLALDALEGEAGLRRLSDRHGRFDFLINCVGVLRNLIRTDDPGSVQNAIAVNAGFPHAIASFARSTGARVIHISTDCVFRGDRERYYEDDPADALDLYGRTKALGESEASNFIALRCSIVGPDPRNKRGLLEWLRSQPKGAQVTGYTDHLWNGVTTLQFARLCRLIIVREGFDRLRREGAVHHFCPNREVSKYDLLTMIRRAFGAQVEIAPRPAPDGPLRLLLGNRLRGLPELFGTNLYMEDAIAELAKGD